MERKNQVMELSKEMVGDGLKPSAEALARELSWREEDVHRCLNMLEKDGKVQTYPREVFGSRKRLVSIYR